MVEQHKQIDKNGETGIGMLGIKQIQTRNPTISDPGDAISAHVSQTSFYKERSNKQIIDENEHMSEEGDENIENTAEVTYESIVQLLRQKGIFG